MRPVLLLAGAAGARRLAGTLSHPRLIASLAGAVARPAPYPCETRIGGFGGAGGLAAWLRAHDAAAMIDATHPFAARISASAAAAAAATGAPLIRLARPPWTPPPGAAWTEVADEAAAAAALPAGARVFLATGRGGLAAFAARSDLFLALRTAEAAPPPPPGIDAHIVAPPPAAAAEEAALFARLGVTHLVARNAGGAAGRAKLDAAAALGLQVMMIRRPPAPAGVAEAPEAAIPAWLARVAGAA